MARYKKNEFSQNLLIPISLQEQIMPGSLEYAIIRSWTSGWT